ncbi:MAG: hypothetical protein K6F92_08885 [Lachnospiraceae bacterium]|nr:hypothetical protein [Lachnospiraceae bacterium]
MYENEVQKAQERLNAALTLAKKQPEEAINMILDMEKWVDETLPNDCPEYFGVVITYNEVMGDLKQRQRKLVEAEPYYKKMAKYAQQLNELDKEKFDIRLAQAYMKIAFNIRLSLGFQMFRNQPVALTEKTQMPYEATINFYKMAITVTDANAKKGSGKHLELRANCIIGLAIMNASIGNYKDAIAMYEDAIKIQKAIYQTLDNKESGVALGNSMATLATLYTLYKDPVKAQESLEDSIFTLKEHENEDPVRSGVLLARNYMNLAGTMVANKADKEDIDDAYEKATKKISMVNAIAKNAAVADEVTCYMLSGQFYVMTGDRAKGEPQLQHALDLVNPILEAQPDNQQMKVLKTRLEMLLRGEAPEKTEA